MAGIIDSLQNIVCIRVCNSDGQKNEILFNLVTVGYLLLLKVIFVDLCGFLQFLAFN